MADDMAPIEGKELEDFEGFGEGEEDLEGTPGEGEGGGEEDIASILASQRVMIAELTEQINDLKGSVKGPSTSTFEPTEVEFFPDAEEFNKADAKSFSKLLNAGVQKHLEKFATSLPNIVANMAQQQVAMMRMADKFYEQNKDLAEYRPYVGRMFAKVMTDNPGLSMEAAMDKVAVDVRAKLGLRKAAQTSEKKAATGLPGARSGRTPAKGKVPANNKRQAQIDAMNKALGI